MSIARTLYSVITVLMFTSCASEYKIHGNSSVSRLDGKMLLVKVPQGYYKNENATGGAFDGEWYSFE